MHNLSHVRRREWQQALCGTNVACYNHVLQRNTQ